MPSSFHGKMLHETIYTLIGNVLNCWTELDLAGLLPRLYPFVYSLACVDSTTQEQQNGKSRERSLLEQHQVDIGGGGNQLQIQLEESPMEWTRASGVLD